MPAKFEPTAAMYEPDYVPCVPATQSTGEPESTGEPDPVALARERRKADTAATDARLGKLEMALNFLSANMPTAAILAEGASGVQAFNMFEELPADVANAVSGAIIAAAKFAAKEFAGA
jgi:hypothetical protein